MWSRSRSWLALLVLAGCGGDERPWQFDAAESVRELPLLEEVVVVRMTREEFAAQAAADADEISEEELQRYADTYGRLGYFDRDLDLRPVFAGSSSDWVGATYSPWTKRITLVGEARDDTFVHEAVHAIQDQNFDIAAYDDTSAADGFLARRAVVEGDATMAQYRFYGEYVGGFGLAGWNWAEVFEQRRTFSAELLAESTYPVVFLDYPAFVYSRGLEFSIYNLTGATATELPDPEPHDWGRQDALFTDHPPATTRAILELATDGGAPPLEIGLADVPAELADRLEVDEWDRLGHFYTYLLLYPLRLELDVEALAAAWVADRVLFLNDLADGSTALIWTSEWASDADAETVEAALWQLHGRAPIKGDPPFRGLSTDGELVHLERRGARLVLARNVDAALLDPLIEGSFAGAEPAAARRKPSLPASVARHRKRFDFARF